MKINWNEILLREDTFFEEMKDNVVSSSKGGGNSWEGFKKVPAVSDLKIQSGMKN